MTDETFTPNDTARTVFKAMDVAAGDILMERFFDLWEADGDPRQAGSMAAHAYIKNGARIAIFGATCGAHEPSIELWLATCEAAFHQALIDVGAAFEQSAADDKQDTVAGD